jgi:hypothetical protein
VRSTLVVIHAASGVAGLGVGLAALAPRPSGGRRWARPVYVGCLVVLLGTLLALIAIDWAGLDMAARVTFSALAVLATVMVYRVLRATREAVERSVGWERRYVDHIAFTYIALWEGFVILPALNLPLPQVSVPAVALGVFVIAHTLIGRYKARVAPRRTNRPSAT